MHEPGLPVTVLTGFLGAGKTTLLNRLLKQTGWQNTAVLINEFGAVGVDHLLVERVDEHTVLLNAGCVCCSIRSDLTQALRDLYFRRGQGQIPKFGRVVIETTGLADPAPILHTLLEDPLLAAVYRLDGVITVVDASHATDHLKQVENLKQVAMADVLVIGKFEALSAEVYQKLRLRLARLNPQAPLLESGSDPGRAPELAQKLLNLGPYDTNTKTLDVRRWLQNEAELAKLPADQGHLHDPDRHGTSIRSFCLEFAEPLLWDEVRQALEMVLSVAGEHVLRIKGVVDIVAAGPDDGGSADALGSTGGKHRRALVIHAVQHHLYPLEELSQWPVDWPQHSRLVFIVRDLEPGYVRQAFDYFVQVPILGAAPLETHS